MKSIYIKPELELVKVEMEDVIVTSNGVDIGGGEPFGDASEDGNEAL